MYIVKAAEPTFVQKICTFNVSMSTVREYGTVRRTLLYGTVRYGTESLNIRTVLPFMLLLKTKILNAFFVV